ncbi:YbgC/FadM family acyl-CoA thioesterase [Humitalea sp. 24SJ18S-53]|uniref:YbgC/FadM family acyl-CoA thioesterase n=1 Tax=Humitalea sp. 24SJ18S-53 TaxID=3422307 RepID=UPI003D67C00B
MSGVHRFPLRVYFEDTDAGGIAYHARYLHWAERARTESLRDIGLPHSLLIERHNSFLVVRRVNVLYERPARLDQALVVETSVRKLGGVSIDLVQDVLDQESGARLARLDVGLVCVRADGLRPTPIPEPWRSALRAGVSPGALV